MHFIFDLLNSGRLTPARCAEESRRTERVCADIANYERPFERLHVTPLTLAWDALSPRLPGGAQSGP